MPEPKFLSVLESSPVPLLSDGAMGTMLNARGINFSGCFDALNLNQPELVVDIHRAYLDAGADLIQTNTFGANRFKLATHGLAEQVAVINQAGVAAARRAIAASAKPAPGAVSAFVAVPAFVAGDVGPLGVRLAPFGRVQPEQAHQAFTEQIESLVEAGIDLLILETFSDLYEIHEAIAAAKQFAPLPVVASMTFTRDDRTLLGDSPAQAARILLEAGADVIGVNCSGGPAQAWRILRLMKSAAPAARLSVMPNAGWPEQVGGRIMYPANPDYFGEYALAFCEAGASLVGGCCGTTPAHIAAMRQALDRQPRGCGPSLAELTLPVEIDERAGSLEGRLAPGPEADARKICGRRRDGPAARPLDAQAARWRQPAGGGRGGRDQRGRQPDGAHAHEPLGGLRPGAAPGRGGHGPALSRPVAATCCASRATCWRRMPWGSATSSWSWAIPPPSAIIPTPWITTTWCPRA